jgi:polyphosphate kinase 2 (PPK2 family)
MLIRSGIIASRQHWVYYSQAKDLMFAQADTKSSPWYVVNFDSIQSLISPPPITATSRH